MRSFRGGKKATVRHASSRLYYLQRAKFDYMEATFIRAPILISSAELSRRSCPFPPRQVVSFRGPATSSAISKYTCRAIISDIADVVTP